MTGPGEYVSDLTEGITRVEDLPKPKIKRRSRTYKKRPEPLAEIFPGVGHQVCEFHVLKEINREILKALTQIRREFKKKLPKLKRGRPSSEAARKTARRKKKLQDKIADLFDHRYLFVKHSLTPREKKIFLRITRGLHNLRKLRSIMDQVYRLFDRRCRTERALEKLAKLRCRIRRFKTLGQSLKKLFTPNIEKALTFLAFFQTLS